MTVQRFEEHVSKMEMSAPSHRWPNQAMVGWIRPHIGKNPSPGFRDDLLRLLKNHREMIDELDRQAAQPDTQPAIAWGQAVNGVTVSLTCNNPLILYPARYALTLVVNNRSPQAVEINLASQPDKNFAGVPNGRVEIVDSKGQPISLPGPIAGVRRIIAPGKSYTNNGVPLHHGSRVFPLPGQYKARVAAQLSLFQ